MTLVVPCRVVETLLGGIPKVSERSHLAVGWVEHAKPNTRCYFTPLPIYPRHTPDKPLGNTAAPQRPMPPIPSLSSPTTVSISSKPRNRVWGKDSLGVGYALLLLGFVPQPNLQEPRSLIAFIKNMSDLNFKFSNYSH